MCVSVWASLSAYDSSKCVRRALTWIIYHYLLLLLWSVSENAKTCTAATTCVYERAQRTWTTHIFCAQCNVVSTPWKTVFSSLNPLARRHYAQCIGRHTAHTNTTKSALAQANIAERVWKMERHDWNWQNETVRKPEKKIAKKIMEGEEEKKIDRAKDCNKCDKFLNVLDARARSNTSHCIGLRPMKRSTRSRFMHAMPWNVVQLL